MGKPLCGGRSNDGAQHDQKPDEKTVRSEKKGSSATPWRPGKIGIVDGEREALPE